MVKLLSHLDSEHESGKMWLTAKDLCTLLITTGVTSLLTMDIVMSTIKSHAKHLYESCPFRSSHTLHYRNASLQFLDATTPDTQRYADPVIDSKNILVQ